MTKDSTYIKQLEEENALLRRELADVKAKLEMLLSSMVTKDSRNSSSPPSKDPIASKEKRTKGLRKKSTRKSGGQKGHRGTTLEFSRSPDEIVDLKSDFCRVCGEDLRNVPAHFHSARQVFDLRIPRVFCVEYRAYERICSICNTKNRAGYPAHVNAPVQYGEQVHSLIPYFSNGQYVPFNRLKNLFSDIFGLSLSEGTIGNSLVRMGKKAALVCDGIQSELSESKVVGSDETGVNVNGKNQWVWVWQDVHNTLLRASTNRGSKTVDDTWEEGLPNAVLVTDRWPAQLKTNTAGKQLCLAHLQRDAQYLIEAEKHPFAIEFKQWLLQVWQAKKESMEKQRAWKKHDKEAMALETELNRLLLYHIEKNRYKQTHTFQMSMFKYKKYLLTTLYHLQVPPDNNASERAIRNVKVKQKVSGFFKSGHQDFCHIRSVIDTAVKRGVNILQTLQNVYKYAT